MLKIQKLIAAWTIIIFSASSVVAQEAEQMLRDLAIPLMAGLTENTEEAIVFDSPEGRIINAQALGTVTVEAAVDYYGMVLPSLGWHPLENQPCDQGVVICYIASREGETLTLNFKITDGVINIGYALSPE